MTKNHCEHCNKAGHTACKDRKPLFRVLIAESNGGKGADEGRKFTGKCYVYKQTSHTKRDCPKKNSGNDITDVNNLFIQMIEVEGCDIKVNNVQLPAR